MILRADGRDQRGHCLLLAQERLRLYLRGVLQPGRSHIGFLVWAHHLFVSGISPYSAMVFSFLSFAVANPVAVKVFNWTATRTTERSGWQAPLMWVAVQVACSW